MLRQIYSRYFYIIDRSLLISDKLRFNATTSGTLYIIAHSRGKYDLGEKGAKK